MSMARFMTHVTCEPNTGCWFWLAALRGSNGYGSFKVDGRAVNAHRWSWEQHRGPIPSGLCVLHRCDQPTCVNPDHLFLGTNQDNVDDKVAKRRHAHGVRGGNAKLTEADVAAVRECIKSGGSQRRVAWYFGVHRSSVVDIIKGRTWAHSAVSA